MALNPPFSGRCLCGAVTYRCSKEPLWQSHCHCESCRRATASGFTSFFGMRDGAWAWTGAKSATFASSPGTWRDFCPTCGTQMAYRSDKYPGECHFYAATLDDPSGYVPTCHVHTDEMLPWIRLADRLPRK
ncbi:MAG: GFA family protein [Tabrizicola sp.]